MLSTIVNPSTQHDRVIETFYEYIISAINPVFKKFHHKGENNTFPCNEWFDAQCKHLKADLNHAIRSKAPLSEQKAIRKMYKQMVQNKKRKHQQIQAKKLSKLCDETPNEFWKFWRKVNNKSQSHDYIDIDTFTSHYKEADKPLPNKHFDYLFK